MIRIANYTITEGKSSGGGYFRDRLKAIRTVLFTLFTMAFVLLFLVYGEPVLMLIINALFESSESLNEIGRFLLTIRWPIAVVLYFLMVSYNYYLYPSEKVKFRAILPGSLFASAGMIIMTYLYAAYVKYIANFDIIYGSLASAVALMFWFFFLSWTLCIGVVCNKAWADTKP